MSCPNCGATGWGRKCYCTMEEKIQAEQILRRRAEELRRERGEETVIERSQRCGRRIMNSGE